MGVVRMKRPAKPSAGLAGRLGSRFCQYDQKVNRIEYWNSRLRSDTVPTVPTWAFGALFWTETAFARVHVEAPLASRNSGFGVAPVHVFWALKPMLTKPWLLPRLPYCGWLKRLKASIRNWAWSHSVMRKFFDTEKSTVRVGGPRQSPIREVPIW